jgi:hypothetical protein
MQSIHDPQRSGCGQGKGRRDIMRNEAGFALAEVLQDAAGIPQVRNDVFVSHLV